MVCIFIVVILLKFKMVCIFVIFLSFMLPSQPLSLEGIVQFLMCLVIGFCFALFLILFVIP